MCAIAEPPKKEKEDEITLSDEDRAFMIRFDLKPSDFVKNETLPEEA